jgi:hypothetical protein
MISPPVVSSQRNQEQITLKNRELFLVLVSMTCIKTLDKADAQIISQVK